MRIYETWAHGLFPKFSLHDFAARAENVCGKKFMRMHLFHWLLHPETILPLSDAVVTEETIPAEDLAATTAGASAEPKPATTTFAQPHPPVPKITPIVPRSAAVCFLFFFFLFFLWLRCAENTSPLFVVVCRPPQQTPRLFREVQA